MSDFHSHGLCLATLLLLACANTNPRPAKTTPTAPPQDFSAEQFADPLQRYADDPVAHAEAHKQQQLNTVSAGGQPPPVLVPQEPVLDTRDPVAHAAAHQRLQLLEQAEQQREAERLLREIQRYTGLSDEQLAQLRTAEVAMLRGEYRSATQRLEFLQQRLADSFKAYKVVSGDSLWRIAGRDSVYGNPELWPLIWHANSDELKSPHQLLAGQLLKIRPNPTISEVVSAVDEARNGLKQQVEIGPITRVR